MCQMLPSCAARCVVFYFVGSITNLAKFEKTNAKTNTFSKTTTRLQETKAPPPPRPSRSMIGGGGRGCHIPPPVLGGDGTKIAPPGDLFDQPPGGMSWIRGKLADHVGDHVVLSPEGVVLVTSPGTESSYPRLPPIVETPPPPSPSQLLWTY